MRFKVPQRKPSLEIKQNSFQYIHQPPLRKARKDKQLKTIKKQLEK
jgi:hypothetical protein